MSSQKVHQPGRRALPRTAIVHDWFQGYHGSERVVEAMRTVFPTESRPDVFTFHAARELLPPELSAAIVQESRLAALPGIRQRGHHRGRWRYLLPLMRRYFRSLNLEEYDLVISSSHAFAVDVRPRNDALHVCYCYTPMRYAWLPEAERGRARALRPLRGRLRRVDLQASRRPDGYVAISEAVRQRIAAAYGRDAVVIHPPVELADLDPGAEKEPGHFVWVQRLVAYKRPLLVAEAFRGLPYRLTMVGIGPLERRLRRRLPPNVTLLGWQPRREVASLLARASGFVHVGEEDFGISMVEALGSGAPVLALARGGALDIVRDEIDGVLVERAEVEEVRRGLNLLAARDWARETLVAHAQTFSRDRFLVRFGAFLEELLGQRGAGPISRTGPAAASMYSS
jgi:glycosyltransferase involved in cell wall biosynthesis